MIGTTNFPDDTFLGVQILNSKRRISEDIKIMVSDGRFESAGLFDDNAPFKAGPHEVKLVSYFNQFWQTADNLALFGSDGANLHGPAIKLKNPDLIDSERVVDENLTLNFPPFATSANATSEGRRSALVPEQEAAILLVKRARLNGENGDLSSEDVDNCIRIFMETSSEITPNKGWSATRKSGSVFTVSYDFNDGKVGESQAMWEVDVTSKRVKYINKNGMYFSWVPKD